MRGMHRLASLLAASLAATAAVAEPIVESREWTERFEVGTAEPVLEIHNVWGDVRVLPGPPGEITLAISERRSAPDRERWERALEVLKLDIAADRDRVSVHVGDRQGRWQRQDPCRGCRVDYQFDARVPPGTRVDARTVNDGSVEVSDIHGLIRAANVNGPVALRGARECEAVTSINGALTLNFAVAPRADCRLETINGDIRLQLPATAGLDLAVDLGNGRLTTEFEVGAVAIPARVERRETRGGHQYRIEQAAGLRVAGGGPTFTVKSLNGDFRIEKIQ